MAENERDDLVDLSDGPLGDTSDSEHEGVRSSNDRDQERERAGKESPHNPGYDEAVTGTGGSVDPDSAASGIDRDDMVDEE